jgi:hypothetical protein
MSLFGIDCHYEHLFSSVKNTKSSTMMRLTDERVEGCFHITTKEIKADIENCASKSHVIYLTND